MKKGNLAKLKRDAKEHRIQSMELVEWHGKTDEDIPPRYRGIRELESGNTTSLTLINQNGEKSRVYYPAAALVKYTDDTLTIYGPGERLLNDKEHAAYEAIKKAAKESGPYESTWSFLQKKKAICEKYGCPHIHAGKKVHGLYHDYYNDVNDTGGTIRDDHIRGKAVLRYRVIRNEGGTQEVQGERMGWQQ